MVPDLKALPSSPVITGTLDLDAAWAHAEGPAPLNCRAVAAMCAAHPGVYELAVPGCGVFHNHSSWRCLAGCTCGVPRPGETTNADNAVLCVRSKHPAGYSVRAAFRTYGVVPYHEFIKQSRRGVNALRQAKADVPRPPAGTSVPPLPPCPSIRQPNVCVMPKCVWLASASACVAAPAAAPM